MTGEPVIYRRLCGPGFFHDPNDMSLVLSVGMMLSLCALGNRRQGLFRFAWLAPIPLFGYALMLTHSRGGLFALVAGVLMLLVSRFGGRRAIVLAMVLSPLIVVFGGRQTNIDTSSGTAQGRIQLWMDGLMYFFRSPLFGVGPNRFLFHVGQVAHNSYVQAFVELGLFGGILFVGMAYYALWMISLRLVKAGDRIADPEIRRMGPYMLAAITSYAVGMLSLTENYLVPTFALFGLASVYIRLANPDPPLSGSYFDRWLLTRLILVGFGTLVVIILFTRFNVHWG